MLKKAYEIMEFWTTAVGFAWAIGTGLADANVSKTLVGFSGAFAYSTILYRRACRQMKNPSE